MKKRNINWKKLLIPIVILGGLFMVFKGLYGRPHASAEDFRKIEMNLAKYIILEYNNVDKIEFKNWTESSETGVWNIKVIINGNNRINYSFDNLESFDSIGSSTYNPDEFHMKEKKLNFSLEEALDALDSVSLGNVEVIYSHEGEEEEAFGF